ncbi:methyltransferase domain-containing protein [Vibrio fluvialis]|nr:methyltransferase domain-containing protein [Vibrio fluvialis]EKO3486061.1 methyltransferase domain-containing protein [Vibrio fluvialis]
MSVSLNQYAKIYSTFENERTRPVFDLLAPLATRTIGNAIDLGCGPGNSTEVLQRFFPQSTIAALDSSEDMIEKAQQRLPMSGLTSVVFKTGCQMNITI